HVAAAAMGALAVGRVPELLDRAREELARIHAGAFRASVELLEEPGERGCGSFAVPPRELELRGAGPARREAFVEPSDLLSDLLGAEVAHLQPDRSVRALHAVQLDRVR